LSPLLVPWIRSAHWKKVLLAAGALQLLMMVVTYLSIFGHFRFDAAWFFGNLVFFFVFGVALNFHLEEIRAWIHRTRIFWLVGLIVFAVLTVVETEIYFRLDMGDWRGGVETLAATLYTLSFVMVFIEFERFEIPYSLLLGKIGQKAYGIYLLHPIVLLVVAKLTYHLAPRILGWPGVFLPLLLLSGIALPLLAMRLVARTPLRKGYRFLFG
ncbi:MAG: hypothetical protein EG825_17815, partial [Rhodocyclaceae bacterium]|nr:hypothetical protein [Rhodocyclaceae bacterium]